MIGALQGTIARYGFNPVIVMVGGVGYAVYLPDKLISKFKPGDKIMLYTHTYVREDALALYGFSSEEELTLFELLLTVSGIGPRTALAVVDRGPEAVQKAVAGGDVDFFTVIPRLGTKNAQKIIIELKNKLRTGGELDLTREPTGETKELLGALISMGFAHKEAVSAIKNLDPGDITLEQKVRHALKLLAK